MVKTEFSIKDLENLSSVKAHTIRIWEKRYHLLEPDRTDTNIRKYDLESLKKLLNITYLYKAGYKISKLAGMTPAQIQSLIKEDMEIHAATYGLEMFKSAMLEFDGQKFDETLKNLLEKKSYSDVYSKIFVPLLNKTGVLWHIGSIDPSHEHFISEKIKHSLILETAKLKKQIVEKDFPIFILYLPSSEIHEISLLYAHYELVSNGFPTLYLGPNIPIESLKHVQKQMPNAVFVSYFTIQPETENLKSYIDSFQEQVGSKNELWILGNRVRTFETKQKNIKLFEAIDHFKNHLKKSF
ncbi:MerR family transcriptional regulator [Brumimicrobium sp.]|uniref:MerR family transcriptional regulator n=1 Tax=Brumimicrobium sp. TaxID=2029867 RepID=UPI003A908C5A